MVGVGCDSRSPAAPGFLDGLKSILTRSAEPTALCVIEICLGKRACECTDTLQKGRLFGHLRSTVLTTDFVALKGRHTPAQGEPACRQAGRNCEPWVCERIHPKP